MARPNSRAGGFNQPPPGTAMRLGTGQRMAGVPPGTAMRLATGVQGPVFAGVGMATEVKVSDRPVTQQGMRGISTAGQGPGRQVQDTSYYSGLLRAKINDMTGEINKFKRDIDQYQKDNSQYAQLERRYEELIKEVRQLEGQLADYNLAMDKARTSTDPTEIEHYFAMLREKNQQEAAEIDAVFLEKNNRVRAIADMEHEMERLRQAAQDKMNSMAPEKLAEFRSLSSENSSLLQQVNAMRNDLSQFSQEVTVKEATLREDRFREEGAKLEKEVHRLRREVSQLEEEANNSTLDPAEARMKLLSKVKEDNSRIVALDKQLNEAQDNIAKQQDVLAGLKADLDGRQGDQGDTNKFEALFKRDQQMSQFIDTFADTRESALKDQAAAEEMITGLLRHISRNHDRETNMPTAQEAKQNSEELSFKARQLKTSESTQSRLEAELNKRNGELDKINNLDSKIAVELKSLTSKISLMQEEVVLFSDLASLRDNADTTRRYLLEQRQLYIRRRDSVKRQVSQLSGKYEQLKNGVSESETAKKLDVLEQKLRRYEQNIFHLQEYIDTKTKETDYRAIRVDCGRVTDQLNTLAISAQV